MRLRKSHIPDLEKTARFIRRVALPTARDAVRDFARESRDGFRAKISAQDFPAFVEIPLSPRYLALKERKGRDTRTMIATGTYKRSIRLFERPRGLRGVLFHIGFERGAKARNLDNELTDTPLTLVAAVQEHGSAAARVPPRPHWRPYLRLMERRAVGVRDYIAEQVVLKWRRVFRVD